MLSPLVLERAGRWRAGVVAGLILVAALPGLPLAWGAFPLSASETTALGGAFVAALANSGVVAILVCAVAFLVGMPVGVCAGLYDFPGRRPLLALMALPLLVPSFLWAIGWSSLAARLNVSTGLLGGVGACVLVFSGPAVSLVLLASFSASQSLSSSQVESARLAGGERTVFLHTTRHVAVVALLAAVLGGVLTLQDPGPGQILGLKTAASEILIGFSAFFDFALAGRQCLVLTLLVLVVTAPLAWFAAPRIASQVLARQTRAATPVRQPATMFATATGLSAIAAVWILLPLLGLLLPLGRDTQFGAAWGDATRTGVDTLLYALGAGAVAVALASALAVSVGRSASLGRIAIAAAIILISLPSAFTALGLVEVASHAPPWTDALLRSRFTVCFALGLRFFPIAAVLMLRGWGSVSPSWTMAAAVTGVPLWKYALRVLLPILTPIMTMALILVGLLATADVGSVLLLHPPGHGSLPLAVFTVMANAPESRVASLCLLYVLLAGGMIMAGWELTRSGSSTALVTRTHERLAGRDAQSVQSTSSMNQKVPGRELASARGFELSSVSKSYDGAPVLNGVSLAIERGANTAILGPSGCGKSTLLRLLSGLETPSAGTISLASKLISEPGRTTVPPHRRGIAMLFQDLALWPNLSVLDNVRLGLSGLRLERKDAEMRARAALALCAIDSLAGARPGRISGGEQQRAALARALAVQPDYLLLDEPFSGLDLATKGRLLDDIRGAARDRGITLILVTHDPIEASTLCQRAVVLSGGVVEEAGAWKDVLREPRSTILRLFAEHLG